MLIAAISSVSPIWSPLWARSSAESYDSGITCSIGEDLYPFITSIAPHSAAEAAKLDLGQQIVSINGKNAAFMGIDQLNQNLRNNMERSIKLQVLNGEHLQQIELKAGRQEALPGILLSTSSQNLYPVGKNRLQAGFYPIDLPSFCRYEASQGPEVVEFYDDHYKSAVYQAIAQFNSEIIRAHGESATMIQLVRLNIHNQELKPLLEHFRIKQAPSYLFLAAPAKTIKDYIDVVRHDLSDSQLREKLEDLLLTRQNGDDFLPFSKPGLFAKWAKITNKEIEQTQQEDKK